MNYIEGPNLKQLIQQQPKKRLSLLQSLTLLAPVVDAVTFLHSQDPPIIHRDIKPSSIIVAKTTDTTVLVDFGIAKQFDTDTTTTAVRYCTPGFAAPEQYSKGTGPCTDIYALGATLYTLLSGKVPADALSRMTDITNKEPDPFVPLQQINPAIPTEISDAISCALSINRKERFATVAEFWQALDADAILQKAAEAQQEANEENVVVTETALRVKHLAETTASGPLDKPVEAISHTEGKAFASVLARIQHLDVRSKRSLLVLGVLLVLLLGVSGTSLWTYLVAHQGRAALVASSPLQPTSSPAQKSTPPSKSSPPILVKSIYPNMARQYKGTIHNIPRNTTTVMSFDETQQQEGIITGTFSGLEESGSFKGSLSLSRHVQLTVINSKGQVMFTFDGSILPDGNVAGSYCSLQIGTGSTLSSCTDYGIWSVSPVS